MPHFLSTPIIFTVVNAASGGYAVAMRILFYLGWVFLVLAFAAGAAESIPRALPGDEGLFVSAYDLWYASKPGSLVVAQIRVEKISPALWDPVIVSVLALPGWLLCLVPGIGLTWFCRPNREMSDEVREGLKFQEESFLLFDRLARDAKEAGYVDGGYDDRRPDHSGHDLINADGDMHPPAAETTPEKNEG